VFQALTRPGDTVLVESPTYFGVTEILKMHGLKAIELPTHPVWGVDLDRVHSLLAKGNIKACFVLPFFSKPFGGEWSEATKESFVAVFAQRQIPIIESDVYRDFHFASRSSATLKDFDENGLVVYCGSFSKTVSAGFRLAWIAPGRYQEQILRLKFLNSISAPALSQLAVAEFMAKGSFDRHLALVRKKLCHQLAVYTKAILKDFPDGTRVTSPNGGFVLWVQLPHGIDSIELYRRALKENIVIAPGPIFSVTGQLKNFLRLSFGMAWSEKVEKALTKIVHLVRDLGEVKKSKP
jgi:DNA-binding transcriptional MocR family regulator